MKKKYERMTKAELIKALAALEKESRAPSPARAVKPWAPDIAWHGLRDWRHWLACALRALLLESSVYGQVARDPSATGPAVLIAVGALFLHAALSGQVNSPAGRVQEIAGWGLVG